MPRAPRLRSHARALVFLAVCLLALSISRVHALDDNLTKGATNNHVFESGVWGENIDLLNGGLNLTIPIGPTVRVSADVSYQLKVAYSSKIWHLEDPGSYWGGNRHHRARSRLDGHGQAGLGFTLQMGRFLTRANSAECNINVSYDSLRTEKAFEDATGGDPLHQVLHARGPGRVPAGG